MVISPIKKPNIPESFHVLIKELQSIGHDLDLLDKNELTEREATVMERYEEIVRIQNTVSATTQENE